MHQSNAEISKTNIIQIFLHLLREIKKKRKAMFLNTKKTSNFFYDLLDRRETVK